MRGKREEKEEGKSPMGGVRRTQKRGERDNRKGEIGVWKETTEEKKSGGGGCRGGNKRGEEGSKVED